MIAAPCPQCKSRRTIALNDTWRRCKDCRHVYRRQKVDTDGVEHSHHHRTRGVIYLFDTELVTCYSN